MNSDKKIDICTKSTSCLIGVALFGVVGMVQVLREPENTINTSHTRRELASAANVKRIALLGEVRVGAYQSVHIHIPLIEFHSTLTHLVYLGVVCLYSAPLWYVRSWHLLCCERDSFSSSIYHMPLLTLYLYMHHYLIFMYCITHSTQVQIGLLIIWEIALKTVFRWFLITCYMNLNLAIFLLIHSYWQIVPTAVPISGTWTIYSIQTL